MLHAHSFVALRQIDIDAAMRKTTTAIATSLTRRVGGHAAKNVTSVAAPTIAASPSLSPRPHSQPCVPPAHVHSSQPRFYSPSPITSSPAPSTTPHWTSFHKPLTLQPILPHTPRPVPAHIPRPDYARPDFQTDPRRSQFQLRGIEVKNSDQIRRMRRACALASYIRSFAGRCVQVGRSTDEIDRLVHDEVIRLHAYPSPLGYANFPKSLCSSVNQAVAHGIPDARKLEEGDILNIDVSVYVDGMHGDCSGMFVAGQTDTLARDLIGTTRTCLDGAISLCGPGVPFSAIGAFIQPLALKHGYSVVSSFCGHGIGATFHMPPLVYHVRNDVNDRMQPGMTFTIEPMLNEGAPEIRILEDGWTYVTVDGGRSAQFEETLLITEDGCEILTKHRDEDYA